MGELSKAGLLLDKVGISPVRIRSRNDGKRLWNHT